MGNWEQWPNERLSTPGPFHLSPPLVSGSRRLLHTARDRHFAVTVKYKSSNRSSSRHENSETNSTVR